MVQGTGSDAGKTLLVAGLCRAYMRRRLSVRPFKPQNMSNNAAVTSDGGEIGRAQALQAKAAGIPPSVHMNPVLLKPTSGSGFQVVVQGRVETEVEANGYGQVTGTLLPRVLDNFAKVAVGADLVLVEGAGSALEVNLRERDIANMGFAEAADLPVLLVGDIERGGVIASIVGTHVLLSESERARTVGYVVNKFHGDPALFEGALPIIAARTGLECFGIMPFFPDARLLPKEDAASLARESRPGDDDAAIRIAVPWLAHIANFDDLDPLAAEAGVEVTVIDPGMPIPGDADLVLLPGTKATLADLAYLRAQGWDVDIAAHARRGGLVVGLCGGYQMLGRCIKDPDGIEGLPGEAEGLALLDLETVISGDKTVQLARGVESDGNECVEGYEIHMGVTEGAARSRPWFILEDGRREGARSADGRVMGGYLHGIFTADGFRRAFLDRIRQRHEVGYGYDAQIEETLDALARHLEKHLNLDRLLAVAR